MPFQLSKNDQSFENFEALFIVVNKHVALENYAMIIDRSKNSNLISSEKYDWSVIETDKAAFLTRESSPMLKMNREIWWLIWKNYGSYKAIKLYTEFFKKDFFLREKCFLMKNPLTVCSNQKVHVQLTFI